jgi:starch synthase
MKILFVSSEVVPFAKTGGLADVAAALPKAIHKIGHDIRIFMPRYKMVDPKKWGLKPVAPGIQEARMPGTDIIVYFVENEHFAERDELYVLDGRDYPDNFEAFLAFCRAAIPFLKLINWRPDVIHCNDWQSGPLVYYVHERRKSDPFFARTAMFYSIHNMAYQGKFPDEKFSSAGLPDGCFSKIGFEHADVISSVSETYAKEIQTKEYGHGLEGVLQRRSKDVYGILNGVDYDLWNPATDQSLFKRYSRMTLSLKINNKTALQEKIGLPLKDKIPLLGITSRLDVQKGFDILVEAIADILQLDCQMVVLGTGDPKYHKLLEEIQKEHPDRIAIKLGFDAELAQQIYAGSDMFLMPSKYEPCGLGQLISFKYGTIPIARKTGGLADTVHDFDPKSGKGNGFLFKEYSSSALLDAVKRAVQAYKDKSAWKKLQEKVMEYDYSWDASAKKYIALYAKALDKIIK